MLRIQHRHFDVVFAEKVQEQLLAFDLGKLAKISIPPEEVKGVVNEAALSARCQFGLQFREVGAALMNDHNLPIDDGLARNRKGAGNLREALGPVETVASEHLLATAVQMYLDPVAVVFDFVNPLFAPGRFGLQGGELGFNEPRHLGTLGQQLNSQKTSQQQAGIFAQF